MALTAPKNVNYAAMIVRAEGARDLNGLDNLVGVSIFGYQALTQRENVHRGSLRVMFLAETQLSTDYAAFNNLHRDSALNVNSDETGYLDKNRRIRAIKLRGHVSNALLMPLSSLAWTGYDLDTLKVGDTFDTLNGYEICRKYEPPRTATTGKAARQLKARPVVDERLFPQHMDTAHLFRNTDRFAEPQHVVITQKLHGTSARFGVVPTARKKSWVERVIVNRMLKINTPDTEHRLTAGSRRVVKGQPGNKHFYKSDVWTSYAETLEGKIPHGYIVYGELIGWVDDQPIQKGYTYNVPQGQTHFYIYRVSFVNPHGVVADLSWDQVKAFAASIGERVVPELWRSHEAKVPTGLEDTFIELITDVYLDKRFCDQADTDDMGVSFKDAVPLSDPKTVDEGICVRVESGLRPEIFKAKAAKFLEYETKQLDNDVVDIESVA